MAALLRGFDHYTRHNSFANGATKATPGARERHMADLKSALSEFDGLFAGNSFLDKMDSKSEPSSPPQPCNHFGIPGLSHSFFDSAGADGNPETFERIIDKLLEAEGASVSEEDSAEYPMGRGWTALRTLRAASEYHHDLFSRACSRLSTSSRIQGHIRDLRAEYRSAKEMRNAGLLVFRDVLEGRSPHGLVEIFAFASLSYTISKLLQRRQRIGNDEVLAGLMVWREAISVSLERDAFDALGRELWPEARDVLHGFVLPDAARPRFPSSLPQTPFPSSSSRIPQSGWSPPSPPPAPEPPRAPELSLPAGTPHDHPSKDFTQHQGNNGAGELPALNQAEITWEPDPPQASEPNGFVHSQVDFQQVDPWAGIDMYSYTLGFLSRSHEVQDIASCLPDIPENHRSLSPQSLELNEESARSSYSSPDPGGSLGSLTRPAPVMTVGPAQKSEAALNSRATCDRAETRPVPPSRLQETGIFRNVCKYISELGDDVKSLFSLIRAGDRSKVAQLRYASQYRRDKFRDDMSKRFFEPLQNRRPMLDRRLLGFLEMAKAFVQLGQLVSPIAVGMYLNKVSHDLAPSLWSEFSQGVAEQIKILEGTYAAGCKSSPRKRCQQSPDGDESDGGDGNVPNTSSPPPQKKQRVEGADRKPPKPDMDGSQEETMRRPPELPRGFEKVSGGNNAKTFPCPIEGCGKTFKIKNSLARHLRTDLKHNPGKGRRCPYDGCPKESTRPDDLRLHWRTKHVGVPMPPELSGKHLATAGPQPASHLR